MIKLTTVQKQNFHKGGATEQVGRHQQQRHVRK